MSLEVELPCGPDCGGPALQQAHDQSETQPGRGVGAEPRAEHGERDHLRRLDHALLALRGEWFPDDRPDHPEALVADLDPHRDPRHGPLDDIGDVQRPGRLVDPAEHAVPALDLAEVTRLLHGQDRAVPPLVRRGLVGREGDHPG
jgi:hypothetical protein